MKAGRKPLLTEAAARLIRREYAEAVPQRKGARVLRRYCQRYGISKHALWQLAHGQTYRWVQ